MFNKILVGIIFVFLVAISIELFIIYSGQKKAGEQPFPISSTNVEYYPVQSGLLSSYLYPFEARNLPISDKLVVSLQYTGVVDQIVFEKSQTLTVKFVNYDVWVALYKQPRGFQPTKCQLVDKATGTTSNYDFGQAPFKKGDKITVDLDVDYKNLAASCIIKPNQ